MEKGDKVGLKNLSQQLIWNSWYKINFGINKYGVHGACPLEMLHWVLLRKLKYLQQMFFEQAEKDSLLVNEINVLAAQMGIIFQRQSYQGLPRTSFSKGIKSGKLQGREMLGLMLVLLAVLRSTEGEDILLTQIIGKQKAHFKEIGKIRDWILLLETMLEFH